MSSHTKGLKNTIMSISNLTKMTGHLLQEVVNHVHLVEYSFGANSILFLVFISIIIFAFIRLSCLKLRYCKTEQKFTFSTLAGLTFEPCDNVYVRPNSAALPKLSKSLYTKVDSVCDIPL